MKTKICFINTCSVWGGGEKWHYTTASYFAKKHDVCMVTNKKSELFHRSKEQMPCFPIAISNLSFINPFKIYCLYKYFKSQNFDAIVLNLPSDVKTSGIAAKLANVKRIIYRRGMPNPIKNSILNRFLFKNVITDIIANSEEIKRSLLAKNQHLFPEENIHVIYNSVNVDNFPEKKKSNQEAIVLGNAGRLVTQKNQLVLIKMVKALIDSGLKIKLLIAGKGELEEQIQQSILEHKVQDHIQLVGFSDNINEFLDKIDIFAFPSLYEGSANILVEVMAKGIPSVTYNRSSMPEMIINNETGLLANDDQEFQDALMTLISSASLRDKLGAQSRAFTINNFNSNDIYKKIETVITS